jgi:hypothetical protein
MQRVCCPSRDVPFGPSTSVSSGCEENLSRPPARMFSSKFRKRAFADVQILKFFKGPQIRRGANRRVCENVAASAEENGISVCSLRLKFLSMTNVIQS